MVAPVFGGSLYRALARLGRELTALHLLESFALEEPRTTFVGSPKQEIDKVSFAVAPASSLPATDSNRRLQACATTGTVFIDKAQTAGFKGVREDVWNFHIGGYQVCEKWLKDRKGRTLSKDDVAHYHKIVVALAETIRLMAEIDSVIANHGGWPGAFAHATTTAPTYETAAREETLAFAAEEPAPYGTPKQPNLGIRTEDELPLG